MTSFSLDSIDGQFMLPGRRSMVSHRQGHADCYNLQSSNLSFAGG